MAPTDTEQKGHSPALPPQGFCTKQDPKNIPQSLDGQSAGWVEVKFPSSLAGCRNEIRSYIVKKNKVGSVSFVTEFLD